MASHTLDSNNPLNDAFRDQIEYLADRAGEERARIAAESKPPKLRHPIRKFLWFGVALAVAELGLLAYLSTRQEKEVAGHLAAPNPLSTREDCIGESYRLSQKVVEYMQANGGKAPRSLAVLVPTYIEKVPIDPITRLPVKYTLHENSFRIECPPAPLTR